MSRTMLMHSSFTPERLLAGVLTGMLMGAALPIHAEALERSRLRKEVKIGVHHVPPPHTAHSKFRTPEAIDSVLAQDLAKRLQVKLALAPAGRSPVANLLAKDQADLELAVLPQQERARAHLATVPTGYVASPMAIMRTDTTIKTWEQLKGRTVCVAEGGRYVGLAAGRYGALEKVFKAPADALLALRIGGCDAAVHERALLEELIKLPEWKKFSAKLPAGAPMPLEFILPTGDQATRAWLHKVTMQWQDSAYLQQQISMMARNIAFEVYLDQHVPDCH
jgi:polar amino acid transport system substrate-binding protein